MSNPSWWFDSDHEIDINITKLYSLLLYDDTYNENIDGKHLHHLIGVIICRDQICRHVKRVQPNNYSLCPVKYTKSVIDISYAILNKYNPHYEHLSGYDIVFVMLPLRHSNISKHIFYASKCAFDYLYMKPYCNIVKQFLKATFKNINQKHNFHLIRKHYFQNNRKPIQISNIIEKYKTVLDIYSHNDLHYNTNIDIDKSFFVNKNVIVSLSGGVDSMVCLDLVKKHSLNCNICAVHLNYMNRNESNIEENFVLQWCKYNNIDCFVRRIYEINRKSCRDHGLRETYETYTKNVRFALYKYAIKSVSHNNLDTIVVLGHNKNDSFENIICNLKSSSKFGNLNGFEYLSTIMDVKIYRPILHVDKSIIYAYSKEHGIPHLKNTTVEWSNRAKIRKNIHDLFVDNGIYDEMFDLSRSYKELIDSLNYWICNSIDPLSSEYKFLNKNHPITFSLIYVTNVFSLVLPNESISKKSCMNFIESLHKLKEGQSKCVMLNKKIKIYVRLEDNHIYLKK